MNEDEFKQLIEEILSYGDENGHSSNVPQYTKLNAKLNKWSL